MSSFGLLVLRVALAVVFVLHGSHMLFGPWSGPGLGGLSQGSGLATVAGIAELVGGVFLGVGWFTRVATVALAVLLGYLAWVQHHAGQGSEIEYGLILIAALVALFFNGPGAVSFDGRRARDEAARAAGRARLRGKV